MKFTASGVANSAAIVRSPSFSRSSSSTTTTNLPARMSSSASSIVANGLVWGVVAAFAIAAIVAVRVCTSARSQALDVLGEHVDLEVDGAPRHEVGERRRLERVWHERDGECIVEQL